MQQPFNSLHWIHSATDKRRIHAKKIFQFFTLDSLRSISLNKSPHRSKLSILYIGFVELRCSNRCSHTRRHFQFFTLDSSGYTFKYAPHSFSQLSILYIGFRGGVKRSVSLNLESTLAFNSLHWIPYLWSAVLRRQGARAFQFFTLDSSLSRRASAALYVDCFQFFTLDSPQPQFIDIHAGDVLSILYIGFTWRAQRLRRAWETNSFQFFTLDSWALARRRLRDSIKPLLSILYIGFY